MALLNLIDEVSAEIENKCFTVGIFLDLSKTLDMVGCFITDVSIIKHVGYFCGNFNKMLIIIHVRVRHEIKTEAERKKTAGSTEYYTMHYRRYVAAWHYKKWRSVYSWTHTARKLDEDSRTPSHFVTFGRL